MSFSDIKDLESNKFIESTSVTGKYGVVVLNPDGSNISAGGGGGGTEYTDGTAPIPGTVTFTAVGGKDIDNDELQAIRLTDGCVNVCTATSIPVYAPAYEGDHTKAESISVTFATDLGDIPITLDGEVIPVSQSGSWTVTANLSATDNAVLDSIAALLTTIDADTSTLASTDFSTSAKQDTTNTHLSNIDAGKLEEDTFTGRIGEVQASPTANTVLARLKDINDSLGEVEVTLNGEVVPVSQSGSWTVDLGATDNAVLDAIAASVAVMDDWDESDRAKVNLIASQAGVDGDAGLTSAKTVRVQQAYNDEWLSKVAKYTSSQSNTKIVDVSSGTLVVKHVSFHVGASTSVNVEANIGFDASTTPTGDDGLIYGEFPAGGGKSNFYGDSGLVCPTANDDLMITCDAPTDGAVYVEVVYKIL